MVEAGIVNDRRDGKNIYYSLNMEKLEGLLSKLNVMFYEKEDCICNKKKDHHRM